MKNYFFLLNILICGSLTSNSQNIYPSNFFSSPVDFKIAIAGTFGELRNDHFHSGIDIKTKQKINIPIYAAQDGYISRIKVSSYGFGKALYLNHKYIDKEGITHYFTTVYAHLEGFNEKITKRVLKEHYSQESFEIDFIVNNEKILIKKGEIIGFSGNTGSSTAPHLHFEIRETKTQKVLNPMLFNLPILDRTFPIIKSILIYYTNGNKEKILAKKINNKTYQLDQQLTFNEPFNIGINTYDLLDAAPNKNGVYSIELYINDSLFFKNKMNEFSFHETKYINSHIDYEYYQNKGEKFQKCFLEPNNKLSTNKKHTNHLIGENLSNGTHTVHLKIKDSYHNSSELKFNFKLLKKDNNDRQKTNEKIINHQQIFEFKNDNCKIYIPNNSLYKDYPFLFQKYTKNDMEYPIYQILHDSIPSHKYFRISMNSDKIPKNLIKKAIVAKIKDGEYKYINTTYNNNYIVGKSNEFGHFTILIDTIQPSIKYHGISNNIMQLSISDELSGIESYRGEIDNKWVLMEYDYKTKSLYHKFRTPPTNNKHVVNIQLIDKVGNKSTLEIDFMR